MADLGTLVGFYFYISLGLIVLSALPVLVLAGLAAWLVRPTALAELGWQLLELSVALGGLVAGAAIALKLLPAWAPGLADTLSRALHVCVLSTPLGLLALWAATAAHAVAPAMTRAAGRTRRFVLAWAAWGAVLALVIGTHD